MLAAQPFSVLLGTRLTVFGAEGVALELDVEPNLRQQHGLVHGGVIAYLVDNAATFAAGAALGTELVTAAIAVDYLRPVRGTTLRARAWVIDHTPSQALMRCDVTVEGEGSHLIAVGTGRASRYERSHHAEPISGHQ